MLTRLVSSDSPPLTPAIALVESPPADDKAALIGDCPLSAVARGGGPTKQMIVAAIKSACKSMQAS